MTKTDAILTLVLDALDRMACNIGDGFFHGIGEESKAAIELCFIGAKSCRLSVLREAVASLETVRDEMGADDIKYLNKLIKKLELYK